MFENLLNLVKEQGLDSVINNPAVPNEQNDAVLQSATHSVTEELQGTLAGGGLQNVLSLFGNAGNNGGLTSNPIVQSIISNFTGKLTSNHGINSQEAGGIAGNLIPGVLSQLIHKTKDPNDSSFDMNSIVGSLTGNSSGLDLNGLLGKFSGGLDSDGDGKVEISDIVSKVTGGSQSGSGGGLSDMLKGFMQ